MRQRRTSPTTARKIVHSCWSGDQQRRIIWPGKSYMVVGQANNNENPKPDSGGRHINRTLGEENRLELLVRRCAKGAQVQQRRRKIIHSCWSGDQQRRRKIIHSCWSGDQQRRRGAQVQQRRRKIVHGCWSGDQQRRTIKNIGAQYA